jgi:hypothetical protein
MLNVTEKLTVVNFNVGQGNLWFAQKQCPNCHSKGECVRGCNTSRPIDEMTINGMIEVLSAMKDAGFGDAVLVDANNRPIFICKLQGSEEKPECLLRNY